MSSSPSFVFPSFYHLPPFFTLQPVLSTKHKQEELWTELILQYCSHHKIYEFNVDQMEKDSELFHNKSINRKLSRSAIEHFLNILVSRKRAEWEDKTKSKCLVYHRTPIEWADIIKQWVDDGGHSGTVYTVYELLEGDTGEGAEFFGLNKNIFLKAIQLLEKKRVVELFESGSGDFGVKFI